MPTTLDAAFAYHAAGLSTIPIARDGTKRPAGNLLPFVWEEGAEHGKSSWKPFQTRLPTEDEVAGWFDVPTPPGIAIIGGKVSGGLELIDFDREADVIFPAWCALVEQQCPGLLARLAVVKTPRTDTGFHVRYRCPEAEIPGNTDLAIDPDAPTAMERTLIQTRGEGGYALAPGSPGACHETGGLYEHYSGPKVSQVETITPDERDVLWGAARYFDRRVKVESPGVKPGEDFDRRGPGWPEILEPHGWRKTAQDGEEVRWCRPGKTGHAWSATTGHCHGRDGADLFRVFSSNAHPFEAGRAYGKFRAWALLNYRGDFSAAAKALAAEGYGDQHRSAQPSSNAAPTANGHAEGNGQVPRADRKAAEPEPWLAPTPLEDVEDQPEPFPLDVLPADVARFFRLAAESLNCPVDYPACLGLGIVAGVTGALYVVDVKPGYCEPLSLYVCVVAPKGCGKTPALKTVADPVYFEAERRRREGEEYPVYVSDVTVEKLADLLRENNRGMPLIRDELAAWFGAMDQYKAKGTGSDRQFWLSAYSCDPVSVHRKDAERPPVFVRYPCVSVIGGIQPPVLARLKGDDDGCFDRILFSFPEPLPAKREDWRQVPERDELAWNQLLRSVMGAKMQDAEGGHTRPWFLKLSAAACRVWEEWTGEVADTWNDPEFPEWLKGPLVKLRGYAARLAGVIHVLREECIPEARNEIEGADMEAGARLARYFLGHARKVYRTMGRDPRVKDAQKVLAWLTNRRGSRVSRRDLWRGLRKSFERPEDLLPPLKLLQAHGFIRWVDPKASNLPPHATDLYSVWPQEAPTPGDR